MGMYTELVLKADVKEDICEMDAGVLNWLFNRDGAPEPGIVPDHPFFRCERWRQIGANWSYYHIPWVSSRYRENYVFCRCDLKNYGNEIALFLDWFYPLVEGYAGACIGWTWYEEEDEPTLIKLPAKMPLHTRAPMKKEPA